MSTGGGVRAGASKFGGLPNAGHDGVVVMSIDLRFQRAARDGPCGRVEPAAPAGAKDPPRP